MNYTKRPRLPREINSLEWYSIITENQEKGAFVDYERLSNDFMICRLKDGRVFLVNDDPPTTNRNRPIEELRKLHITDEEWDEQLRKISKGDS